MQVLIFPLGSLGDVHPFVGLGQTLKHRGHDVTVAANGAFSGLVEQAGLRFAPVGSEEELQAAFEEAEFWHPYLGFQRCVEQMIRPAMRRQYDVIAERYLPGRTVVVGSTVSMGARVAHDKLGVPLVSVHVQPMVLWSEYRSPVIGPLLLGDWMPRLLKRMQFRWTESMTVRRWMLEPANEFRAELDLPPLNSMSELLNSPQRVIALFPDWFAPRQPDWPPQLELVGFPLWDDMEWTEPCPELEEFLAGGEPPIAFTLSSTDWHATEFFEAAVGACRLLQCRGVLLASNAFRTPAELPEGVKRFDYVPFRQLLSRVAALVHHGGLGTGAQAMAAGIPQVIRGVCFDQPDNAERLRRIGVAETVRYQDFRPEKLARVLARMLASPVIGRRCAEVAARMQGMSGLVRASEVVEDLLQFEEAPTDSTSSRGQIRS